MATSTNSSPTPNSFTQFDPFEDTERTYQALPLSRISGFTQFDPFEDTERGRPMPRMVAGPCFTQFDPFEDTERTTG